MTGLGDDWETTDEIHPDRRRRSSPWFVQFDYFRRRSGHTSGAIRRSGIKSITYGGCGRLLAGGQIDLARASSAHDHNTPEPITEPKISFDAAANQLLETYDWGTIACVYRIDGDRLYMDITVHNTSKDSIRIIDMGLLHLQAAGLGRQGEVGKPLAATGCGE